MVKQRIIKIDKKIESIHTLAYKLINKFSKLDNVGNPNSHQNAERALYEFVCELIRIKKTFDKDCKGE
jgi:hypothetical protein